MARTFIANFISEDQIEQAILGIFTGRLGYRHLNCLLADLTGRSMETEVVIEPLLRKKLIHLNPAAPEAAIDFAVDQLTKTRLDQTDFQANKELYFLMRDGVTTTIKNTRDRDEPVTIKVIDLVDESQNDYLVVSQLWLQGSYIRRRPDLIVFVNGLPLIFIELKNSTIALRNAYDDNLTNYRKDIPLLFHYNALCILSNGLETKVGSFNSGYNHFLNWLRVENEDEVPDKERIKDFAVSLDYAILGLCEKARLLDYFENFLLYYNDVKKIAAKNHQFLGVNNAARNFGARLKHDKENTDTGNKGKLGVFWHTQGSGKSYSMIFFARKVFRKFTGNYTFLIVTDRDDLDGQIYKNFVGAGAVSKTEKCRPQNSEELRELLQTNRRYIFTLIHKFRFPKGKAYPVLSTRNDIIVIVDEAHRTQYKDLAENMRTGLPNAQYMAFTGTPLLGSKKLTNDWFGENVSEYNFKQSIEDGATVPLFYHKRVPEVLLQNDDLDDDLAEIVSDENLSDADQQRLENEFGQEMAILKSDDRLETIAKDIVFHFPRRGYLGKGMVITFDKFTAVKMYDKVKRLWDEEKRAIQSQINSSITQKEKEALRKTLEWMRKADMAVIISEEAGEEEKFEKNGLDIRIHRKRMLTADDNGKDLEDKFKEPTDPLQLVFVCSMWLTGFDAETVSTLYIDKPMKDHTLMQTIARANRVTDFEINGKPKKNGLIVDYYNVFKNLREAFASYGGGKIGGGERPDEDAPVKEKDQLYVLLQDAIDQCDQYCKNIDINLKTITESEIIFGKLGMFDQFADIILANDDQKKQFIVYDNTIDALYQACLPEILGRRKDFPLVAVISYLRQIIDGKNQRNDLDSAKRRISQLLDESIVASDEFKNSKDTISEPSYNIKAWRQIDLSKLDVDKLKEEFKEAPYKHIEIADLRAFISNKLEQMMSKNITRTSFAQKLQQIIDRYNSGGSITEDYFNDLVDFVGQLKAEELRAAREGLSEKELEIFDLLKKENLTKEEDQKVKLAAKSLLHRLYEEKPTVLLQDWHKDLQSQLKVKLVIQDILDKNLPETYDKNVYDTKCNIVFNHLFVQAANGGRAVA
ncbi:type I restriction endonuclease subunit R [Mucilaginibacter gotjawali]|uniref:Type I restriction enzyme R subunit n=2 Tax=Mucilaginibacter gotjawali TaxID=1550579 RepID=A0A839SDC1_9SPHI|nr:HsdR family type I site-specific deoxyribonuclease [Mucilaginibacter gotjawali]MBB3055283.1 type I restriction enzyme R subunit [Mucilaginibacter gotjawali]BAU56098.1 Type-1 restriction enzyme R protein [Mucilaginibacter gotjawali]